MKTIVIAPYEAHRILFKEYRKNDLFSDTKFITLDELIANTTYSFSLDAVRYLIKKLNISFNVARRYLNVLIYLKEEYKNQKYSHLYALKDELIENNLLIKNDLFSYELTNARIDVCYYAKSNPFLKKLLDGYEVNYRNDFTSHHDYHKFPNSDDQLFTIFNEIESLLNNGVKPEKIFIYGLTKDDKAIFDRLVKNYGLNVNGAYKKKLIDLPIVRNIILNYDGDNATLKKRVDELDEYKEDIKQFLNDYLIDDISLDLQKSVLYEAAEISSIKEDVYATAIKAINLPIIDDDEYLFFLNYAQGMAPILRKDDDFLDDLDKANLGITTSEEINIALNDEFIMYLKQKGNIYLAYPNLNSSKPLLVSPLVKRLDQHVINEHKDLNIYSFFEAKLQLANLYDIRRKYIYEHPFLKGYEDNLSISYQDYKPDYNGVNHFNEFNNLTLSYSQINNYIKCSYKYYLNYVLKLDELESTFMMAFGSLAHEVLASIDSSSSFDEIYEHAFNNHVEEFNDSNLVFLIRLKDELRKTFNFVKESEKACVNGSFIREEPVDIKVSDNIKLVGRIDKIVLSGDSKQYASIIDYKSGSETFNFNNLDYGFSLQLPIYSYIFKNLSSFSDKKLIALATERIISDAASQYSYVNDDSYFASVRLNGIFLKDDDALSSLDRALKDKPKSSQFISSVGYKSDGGFAKPKGFPRLQEEQFFTDIADTAHNFINLVGEEILKNNFSINPKIIKGKNESCQYCPFRDICFRNYTNYVVLSALEEDENGD